MKAFLKLCVSIISLTLVLSGYPVQARETNYAGFVEVPAIHSENMQYTLEYPLPAKKLDTSLSLNHLTTFKSYLNQGYLYLEANKLDSADLFLNGKRLVLPKTLKDNVTYRVDISSLTKNEASTLQVTNIKPDTATLKINIPYPTISYVMSGNLFSQEKLAFLDLFIHKEIEYGFPGAQLAIVKNGVMIKNSSYGYINNYDQDGKVLENRTKINNNTLFDLASNTKMFATNLAIQRLVSQGKLRVEAKIKEIFPTIKDPKGAKYTGKANLTIKDLLTHEAGFASGPKFFRTDLDIDDGVEDGINLAYSVDKKNTLRVILEELPLTYEPNTKTLYSDVDYMLLGLIIEKITGKSLDEYVAKEIYQPLGLKNTMFTPLANKRKIGDCAATELQGNTRSGTILFDINRTKTIQCEVHDEKSYYSMNGVSGHAGLFSTAYDIALLSQMMLNGGGYGDYQLANQTVIEQFTSPKSSNASYGLGWRRTADDLYEWAFGEQSSSMTYGHTGWTGTLSVIDPTQELVIVLLTNAKNSPIIDVAKDKNYFLGDSFLLKNYGNITTLIYDAFQSNSMDNIDALLPQMIDDQLKLLKEAKKEQERYYQSMYALVDVTITRMEKAGNKIDKELVLSLVKQMPDTATKQKFLTAIAKLN